MGSRSQVAPRAWAGKTEAYRRIGSRSELRLRPPSFASEVPGMVLSGGETVARFHGSALVF